MAADLNHHHRVTLEKIFSHPLSGNVEWRQVRSLLEAQRRKIVLSSSIMA